MALEQHFPKFPKKTDKHRQSCCETEEWFPKNIFLFSFLLPVLDFFYTLYALTGIIQSINTACACHSNYSAETPTKSLMQIHLLQYLEVS